ncbi:ABC transporter substrate-binding protein [Sphingosinicella soli]|uniref:Iron complex transport system substrate-binding protein n=1 Tax=Sphingosinicella soli TaxID=333708 RepID=A0A7W7F4S0_9SPHN|nr:ABC transporter substrate-binding protein [Sphingosinicella soli]MBB4630561.1 iron complex transport system substrate-binding protein [Sphingosinicella soli]
MGRLIALFGLIAFAAAAAEAAAPVPAPAARVASLGLCTDELALLLAEPGQLVSISFLGHERRETPLARKARGLHSNDGKFSSVAHLKPDLVITGGVVNRFARELAERTGTRVIDVPPPMTLDDLRRNIRTVAAALGHPARAEALIGWMDARLGAVPDSPRAALMIVAGGLTPDVHSIAAELLSHAGIRQMVTPSRRVTLEGLIAAPPPLLILSHYRASQFSLPQDWLGTAKRISGRTASVDGRLWSCPGPLAAADVARLRAETRP